MFSSLSLLCFKQNITPGFMIAALRYPSVNNHQICIISRGEGILAYSPKGHSQNAFVFLNIIEQLHPKSSKVNSLSEIFSSISSKSSTSSFSFNNCLSLKLSSASIRVFLWSVSTNCLHRLGISIKAIRASTRSFRLMYWFKSRRPEVYQLYFSLRLPMRSMRPKRWIIRTGFQWIS